MATSPISIEYIYTYIQFMATSPISIEYNSWLLLHQYRIYIHIYNSWLLLHITIQPLHHDGINVYRSVLH